MAGFVVLYQVDTSSPKREGDYQKLLEATAHFKGLALPAEPPVGVNCTAAKLVLSGYLNIFSIGRFCLDILLTRSLVLVYESFPN